MGARVFEKCYPTQEAAVDAFYGTRAPTFSTGELSFQSWHEKIAGQWVMKRQMIDRHGEVVTLPTVQATIPTFLPCDELEAFNDGVTVGWMLAGAILLGWGLLLLQRLIR